VASGQAAQLCYMLQQQTFAGHSARPDPDPHLATGSLWSMPRQAFRWRTKHTEMQSYDQESHLATVSWSMPRQASKWRAQHCSRENSLCTCAETQLSRQGGTRRQHRPSECRMLCYGYM